jgi:low temperature requirement protein LtrA
MWRRVALVRADVLGERIASIIKMTRIGELATTLAVSSSPILVTVMMEAIRFSETFGSYMNHTASRPKRRQSSYSPPWKPQILYQEGCFEIDQLTNHG